MNLTTLGIAVRDAIPGIYGKQVMENGERFRVFVLKRRTLPLPRPADDLDDLL